jgi:hypothetical protein
MHRVESFKIKYFHIAAARVRSLYTHKNGMYSDFPLQPLWMGRENQKDDLAFHSRRTYQVPYNSIRYRGHFVFFCTV